MDEQNPGTLSEPMRHEDDGTIRSWFQRRGDALEFHLEANHPVTAGEVIRDFEPVNSHPVLNTEFEAIRTAAKRRLQRELERIKAEAAASEGPGS